jgi:K+-transporting ATPase A subunit
VEHRGVVRDQHELAGYSGETTMSYLSQMGSLAVQNFVSAAGIAVAVALIRGFSRHGSATIGKSGLT